MCFKMLKLFILTCLYDIVSCLPTFEKDHRYQGKLCTPHFQDFGEISGAVYCGVRCESSSGCRGFFHSAAQKKCFGLSSLPQSQVNCSSNDTFHLYRKLACDAPPVYANASINDGNRIARQFTCARAYVRTVPEIYCDVHHVTGMGKWQPTAGICTEMYGSNCDFDTDCADIEGACIHGICTCIPNMAYDLADMLCKPKFKLVVGTDGNGYTTGQLYMLHEGLWGNVCWEHWHWTVTKAVCQDINPAFIYGGTWHEMEVYGRGFDSPSYKLNNVDCGVTGDVTSITNCTVASIDNCDHNKDVGLTCYDADISGTVRLNRAYRSDGVDSETRLEVLYNGTWGTVCQKDWNAGNVACRTIDPGKPTVLYNGTWGTVCQKDWNAGNVACRTIDPGKPERDQECKDSCAGGPSGPYKVSMVQCDGDEPHLFYCKNGGWDSNPSCPGDEVGLLCQAP